MKWFTTLTLKYFCSLTLVFLLIAIIKSSLLAQAPVFYSYKILKNISNIQVNAITQDNKGYLWLGTNYGLIRYDGVDFTPYTVKNGLSNDNISCLAFNPADQTLWIGHQDGSISTFCNQTFAKFQPEEGMGTHEISSIFFDQSGIMWFTTLDEGVYYFTGKNRKRLYNIDSDNGLLDNYVYSMLQVNDSIFHFATDKGISEYNFNQNLISDHITTMDGLPDNLVLRLHMSENLLWIGMNEGGICTYNVNTKQFHNVSDWPFGSITDMLVQDENEVWVATQRNGLVRINYDPNGHPRYTNFKQNNGLPDQRIISIFADREQNIWIGTKKGLALIKNNHLEFLTEQSGFGLNEIFGITGDSLNRLWLATQNGLFVHSTNDDGSSEQLQLLNTPELEAAIFISAYRDARNQIWIGTYGFGVFRFNPVTMEVSRFTTANGLAGNDVLHISGDSLQVWLSTVGGGVSCVSLDNTAHIKNFNEQNGLPSNYIYSTFVESPDKIWVSTDGGGICTIENGRVHPFTNSLLDSLPPKIYSVVKDKADNLWINTAEMGIVKIAANGKSTHFNEMTGLSSNNIQSLGLDGNNQLIATSKEGLILHYVNDSLFNSTGEESGLANMIPNLNTLYNHPSGDIYIGTSKGIVKVLAGKKDSDLMPILQLTNKRLFFNEIEPNKVKFRFRENNLSFSYTAIWYKAKNTLLYRYMLEGYDMEWSSATTLRSVTYPKLPDGKYKFRVQVKIDDGFWYESPESTYAFTIRPPFWKTIWFIILSVIVVVVSAYTFFVLRIRRLEYEKAHLEEEVQKRTAEIQKQKNEIANQKDEIEAQRNHVMEQRDQIEKQNEDITASILYASNIQRAVLPPLNSFNQLLGEHFVFFKPRDIVSGDFYYLNTKFNRVVVAAADCTGHGVPGAFMSILSISLLNQIMVELESNFDAGFILTRLRIEIKKALRQTGENDLAKDGLDISLCVIDAPNRKLDFAGAFNPLLLVREQQEMVIKGDKMPIGIHVKEAESFTNHSLDLQPNDMLYMFSDGFQDQFGGEAKRKFLPGKLRELLVTGSLLPMAEQRQRLETTFEAWKGTLSQIDDVLVIGVKVS